MTTITTYNIKTGQFYCIVQCPDELVLAQVPDGLGYVEGDFSGETHWFDLNLKSGVERPSMPCSVGIPAVVANGLDVATITNLPTPCIITVGGQSFEVDDGTVELTFDEPGVHTITLSAWPYVDHTVEITAYED